MFHFWPKAQESCFSNSWLYKLSFFSLAFEKYLQSIYFHFRTFYQKIKNEFWSFLALCKFKSRLCNVYWKNKKNKCIATFLKFKWVDDSHSIYFKRNFLWLSVINLIGRENKFSFFEWRWDYLWWNVMLYIRRQMSLNNFLRKNTI